MEGWLLKTSPPAARTLRVKPLTQPPSHTSTHRLAHPTDRPQVGHQISSRSSSEEKHRHQTMPFAEQHVELRGPLPGNNRACLRASVAGQRESPAKKNKKAREKERKNPSLCLCLHQLQGHAQNSKPLACWLSVQRKKQKNNSRALRSSIAYFRLLLLEGLRCLREEFQQLTTTDGTVSKQKENECIRHVLAISFFLV